MPTSSSESSGALAVVVTRLAGLWIIAGALFKLFLGRPTDLPRVIQELPPDLPLTFKVVIAAELTVGLLALLKPRWSWLLLMALLVLFSAVLVTQIHQDAESCGCFGHAITIPPALMLGIDGLILLLLLVSRPWLSMGRDAASLAFLVLVLAVVIPLPWVLDREARGSEDPPGPFRQYAIFEPEKWVGKPIEKTNLAEWVDVSTLPKDGLWVLWRESCEICADLFPYLDTFEFGERPLVLIELPEPERPDDERVVHALPTGPHVKAALLPDDRDWLLETPGGLVLKDGCVIWGKTGMTIEDHAATQNPPVPEACK